MSPKRRSSPTLLVFGTVVSVGFLAYFFSGVEVGPLLTAIRSTNLPGLAVCIALALLTYPVRAYRWRFLIPGGDEIPLVTLLSATTIGFMTTSVLPGRLGEVARATVLSLRSPVPWGASFASIVVERLFDLIVILTILVVVLTGLPGTIPGDAARSLEQVKAAGLAFFGLTVALIVTILLMKTIPDQVMALAGTLLQFLPPDLKEKLLGFARSVIDGLTAIGSAGRLVWVLVLSYFHWSISLSCLYVLLKASHLDVPVITTGLIFVFVSLAVALPQAPGFLGVHQVASEAALKIMGGEVYATKGFALLSWAISIIPITLVGFYFLSREGLSLGSLTERSAATAPDPPHRMT